MWTTILATWGAVVSTLVAFWGFYEKYAQRDRVIVEAGFHIWSVTRQEVLYFKVFNRSSHMISVTHICGTEKQSILRRLFRRKEPGGWLFSFDTLNGLRLPYKIEAWDDQIFLYETIQTSFPQGDLYVITAGGREWYRSRKYVKAIHASETYKKQHP